MKQVAQEMTGNPQWQEDIIGPVSFIGMNRLAHSKLPELSSQNTSDLWKDNHSSSLFFLDCLK
jgi:hypothetical protein